MKESNLSSKDYENPFWTQKKAVRCPVVLPIVCAAGYHGHFWKKYFSPMQEENREEVTKQLETLEYFRNPTGSQDGNEDVRFRNPSNDLKLRHKAPLKEDSESLGLHLRGSSLHNTTFEATNPNLRNFAFLLPLHTIASASTLAKPCHPHRSCQPNGASYYPG